MAFDKKTPPKKYDRSGNQCIDGAQRLATEAVALQTGRLTALLFRRLAGGQPGASGDLQGI